MSGFARGVAVVLFVGCSGRASSLDADVAIERGPARGGKPISQEVNLIADIQFHHALGDPGWMRSERIDKYVGSAIRPPVLEMFVGDLATWFLHEYGNSLPTIVLGDAADLSCRSELQAFEVMMKAYVGTKQVPWFFAPGNHDGYFFGDYYDGGELVLPNVWAAACAGAQDDVASRPLLKPEVVRWVLEMLKTQPDRGAQELASRLTGAEGHGSATVAELDASAPPADVRMLTGVAWNIDTEQPWRSFVVQRLDLSGARAPAGSRRVTAILVDTAAYTKQPRLVPVDAPNAGLTGDLPSDERDVIEQWAKLAHARNDVLVVMGHHHYDALTTDAQRLVDKLHDAYGLTTYISAHTHAGRWYVHGSKTGTWAELNVGSMITSPIEFRTLQVMTTDAYTSPGQIAIHSELRRVESLFSSLSAGELPECKQHLAQGANAPAAVWACGASTGPVAWEAMENDPDNYVAYNEVTRGHDATQLDLLNLLLAAHQRLLAAIPSSAAWGRFTDQTACEAIRDARADPDVARKQKLLRELAEAEPRRPADPTLRASYRVCQAVWATTANYLDGRRPKVEDATIVLPVHKDL